MEKIFIWILLLNIVLAAEYARKCGDEVIDHCTKCNTGENSDNCEKCEDKYFPFFNNLLCLPCNDSTYGQIGCQGNCDGSNYVETRFAFCEEGGCKGGYYNLNGICMKCSEGADHCINCTYEVQEESTNGNFICHQCENNTYRLTEHGTCEKNIVDDFSLKEKNTIIMDGSDSSDTTKKGNIIWNGNYNTWNVLDNSNNIMITNLINSGTRNIINQSFTECNDGYYLMYNTNDCYNETILEQGYYLDKEENPYILKKCYERCKKCSSSGNFNNMNCYSCIENYFNEEMSKSFYFKLTTNGNCIEYCPDTLYLTLAGECVEVCPKGTYQYTYNNSCLESCPYNYEINKEENKCIIKSFTQTITSYEFKYQIMNDITSFVNSSVVINGSDFKALILTSNDMDPTEQIKKGISAIDLGNCTQIIKDYYNISDNDYFIVLNMETKNNERNDNNNSFNLGKNMQVEIFDSSGRKLDFSVCKEDIKVMKYIGDATKELNIQSAKNLADQGIDVFNSNDSFFNDLCHKYDNKDGKDIIIDDRRANIYQNATFCQDGCYYQNIDYELMAANCMCETSALQNSEDKTKDNKEQSENLNFKTITKSFISSFLDFNIEVIFCWNLVFDKDILFKNIGFYFMASLCFIQIVILCIFSIKRLLPIKKYMYIFKDSKIIIETAFPPKKIKMLITRERLNRINNQIKNNIIKQNIDGTNINLKKYIDESNIFNNKKIDEINNDDIKRKFQTIKNINNSNNEIPLNKIMEEKFQNKLKQRNENNKINLVNINSFTKNELISQKDSNFKEVENIKEGKYIINNKYITKINIENQILNTYFY